MSLYLIFKYIIVVFDNVRIYVFDIEGNVFCILQGYVMGVWVMVFWDDILVSGGCDREVWVWDLMIG